MFASDIGMNHIEEINIVRNGENYGWMRREGYLENGRSRGGELNELFPLPADVLNGQHRRTASPIRSPIYDHDEGAAVTDGFAYHGRIAALRGKFVFGDIQRGRLFAADLADDEEGRRWDSTDGGADRRDPALRARRQRQSDERVVAGTHRRTMGAKIPRADLHISRTRDGELLITSRQDGMIRMLVEDSAPKTAAINR